MTPAEFFCRRSGDRDIERAWDIWATVQPHPTFPNLGTGNAIASLRPLEWRDAAFFAFRSATGILSAVAWITRDGAIQGNAGAFRGTSWQVGKARRTMILTATIPDAMDLSLQYSLPVWASGFDDEGLPALPSVEIPQTVRTLYIAGRRRHDLEMGETARRLSRQTLFEYLWLDEEGEHVNGRGC